MLGFNDVKWQLSVAEAVLQLEVANCALLNVLIDKGIITTTEYFDKIKAVKEDPDYKKSIEKLLATKEELNKEINFAEIFGKAGNKDEV